MEPTPPVLAKKLWNIVRIVFLMLGKKVSKSKLLLDLHHLMTKRGKILEKVIENLMFHHHSSFSCRSSNDVHMSFIAPKDYEFSCSNSPAFPFHKRKKHHHAHFFTSPHRSTNAVIKDDVTTVSAVQKILEMLNNEVAESSPVFPGSGRSPFVRQLRITDSPFPLRDVDENSQVDKEAEEFIERFYEQLRLQKNMSTREARSHRARSSG
ncbi:hypothetical protein IFM89_011483 [Coptis chinensis]|uniref:Avr9/Cf-9 rapidly elicited protein n=1 Tax=Coptis chinensis TaxID=261450 RepID=A0A835IBI5_9MAGN|nr:hypothetical protein IFM89_011483 [Coptis chinensis]